MNRDGELVILHLSDLHCSGETAATTIAYRHLAHDIRNGWPSSNTRLSPSEPRLPEHDQIDLAIVTGDLTQHATAAEFADVGAFLSRLAEEFLGNDHNRLVVAPGNHDVDWRKSRAAYAAAPHPTADMVKSARTEAAKYRIGPGPDPLISVLYERTRPRAYVDRFRGYATFFQSFYGPNHAYSLDATAQYTIYDSFASRLGILVVAFNSCHCADHLWHRGSICEEAILSASAELDRNEKTRGCARLAVWHHNILGTPDEPDFMDPRVAPLLSEHGFRLGLHGHVHKAGRLDMMSSHARMPVVWAGSLGSPDRPESTPLLYNVIGLRPEEGTAWVHVRSRDSWTEEWTENRTYGEGRRCWYPIELATPATAGMRRVYSNVGEADFQHRLEELIKRSHEVTFIGTGLNAIQGGARNLIVQRTCSGEMQATMCFGNPYAEHVRERLAEEERCDPRPEVAVTGIITRVRSLLDDRHRTPNLRILLFNNYPTLSIFRFDDLYVYYVMGYRRLGNRCPLSFVERSSIYGQFLDDMVEKYLADAVDAEEVFRVKRNEERSLAFVRPDTIVQAAIYIIPDPESSLYALGSWAVGYDVFSRSSPTLVPDGVSEREAAEFKRRCPSVNEYGFHVTLADVMYIPSNQIPTLRAEMNAIAAGTPPFQLQLGRVATGVGQAGSVVVTVDDPTGHLEKLAAEVAVRLRPSALGTRYSLETPVRRRLGRLTTRDDLMLNTYQSPNVFNRYRPHFTLAVVPVGEDERLRPMAERLFRSQLNSDGTFMVNRLYVVTRALGQSTWEVPQGEDVVTLHHQP